MIFAGVSYGELIALSDALSVEINQEIGIAADDITVVFNCNDNFPKLSRIYALDESCDDIEKAIESGNVVFSGIVDEQVLNATDVSARITVYARSPAALLIDNESPAQTYVNPSLDVLYHRHLEQFGIKLDDTENGKNIKTKGGEMRIFKGDTHYRVIEKFCTDFLGTQVRIDHMGICRTDVLDRSESLIFDNSSGVTFNSVSICDSICNRISKIFVCTDLGLKYNTIIEDKEAQKLGIVRERYLNTGENSPYFLSNADTMIENGIKASYSVTVRSDERILNMLGCKSSVNIGWCSGKELTVNAIHYKATSSSEESIVKLIMK